MHIIHLIESLGIGGAQSMLFEIYCAIQKYYPEYKQDVILVETRKDKPDYNFAKSYGVSFLKMSRDDTLSYVKKKNNTVVFYHKLFRSDTKLCEKLGKYSKDRVPFFVISHTFSDRLFTYYFPKNASAIVSVCQNMKHQLEKKLPGHRHEVVYNGVNYYRYSDIKPKEREERKNNSNVIITGRINQLRMIKHSNSWLDFCSKMNLKYPMIHDYIGDGIFLKTAIDYAKRLNSNSRNKINLLGRISDFKEKVSVIKSWDVFFYNINVNEGVSVSILESLACGTPVVCCNHYGNKEIIVDGVNGYVYKDLKHATEIMEDLCKNKEKLLKLKESTIKHFKENLDESIRIKQYMDLSQKFLKKMKDRKNNE